MNVTTRVKSRIIDGVRALPPTAFSHVPFAGPRRRLLGFHSEVLRVRPKAFTQAQTRFGFTMDGTTADLLQRNVYLYGVWEPNISRWVSGFLADGDVVVDIGANVGYFSLLCATCVGRTGRVIAFEPVPSIVAALQTNISRNDATAVEVHPVIASDQAGSAEIFRGAPGNLGLSSTEQGVDTVSEGEVRMIRAAEAIDADVWATIRLVKVDTEGDDLRALTGLEPALRAMRAGSAAVVEVTPEDLEARGQTPAQLVAFMQAAGFTEMLGVENSYEGSAYAEETPRAPVRLSAPPTTKTDVIFLKPSA